MDHNKVIDKIKAGSEEELALIYKKYRKEFINWIGRNYGCSVEDSKDIYQSAIITLYESIIKGKLVELRSSLKTYLFAIGKNKMQEHRRHLTKQESFMENVQENLIFGEDDYQENDEMTIQLVEKCLDKLGDPCKTLLQLYYYNKLSIPQITSRLNYKNADTSKNLKYKCLQRLKKIYQGQVENSK